MVEKSGVIERRTYRRSAETTARAVFEMPSGRMVMTG
jgi:hypothetical protein